MWCGCVCVCVCVCVRVCVRVCVQVWSCALEEMLLLLRGVCAAAGLFTLVQSHCIIEKLWRSLGNGLSKGIHVSLRWYISRLVLRYGVESISLRNAILACVKLSVCLPSFVRSALVLETFYFQSLWRLLVSSSSSFPFCLFFKWEIRVILLWCEMDNPSKCFAL